MSFPKEVKIVEVSPRDGLQNEASNVSTDVKIDFINRLSDTGLSVIEVTSFVSPKWIPQLADNVEVYQRIHKNPQVTYPVLIPNVKGLQNAIAAGVTEIAVFTTPSEQFSQHNTHCSVAESLARVKEVCVVAKEKGIRVRGYISCVWGCPYEGEISSDAVINIAEQIYQMGCYEISLGDTIGVSTPLKTAKLLEKISTKIPKENIAVHFHDTYGQALANIYAALQLGIATVDSSVAGLGGCPYAKGASGNVATEDVVYMLNGMRIKTGIDLTKLAMVGNFISDYLQRKSNSKAAQAILAK